MFITNTTECANPPELSVMGNHSRCNATARSKSLLNDTVINKQERTFPFLSVYPPSQNPMVVELFFDRSFSIGRDKSNNLVLNSPSVSRKHLKLVPEGNRYIVFDINSKSGTSINGKKLESGTPYYLEYGDILKISDYIISYSNTISLTFKDKEVIRHDYSYSFLPKENHYRFRITDITKENLQSVGKPLQIGKGGLLIPTQKQSFSHQVLEIEIFDTAQRRHIIPCVVNNIIANKSIQIICAQLYRVMPNLYAQVVRKAIKGQWISPLLSYDPKLALK